MFEKEDNEMSLFEAFGDGKLCQYCGSRVLDGDGCYQSMGSVYACDGCIEEYVKDGYNSEAIMEALKEVDYFQLTINN